MLKECKHHGTTEYSSQGKGKHKRFRCKKCIVVATRKRRKKLKDLSVEYKGGSCERCGYTKCTAALEFHHLDPEEKDFGIGSRGHTRSFEKIKIELDKCIMLCANCHREEHERLRE